MNDDSFLNSFLGVTPLPGGGYITDNGLTLPALPTGAAPDTTFGAIDAGAAAVTGSSMTPGTNNSIQQWLANGPFGSAESWFNNGTVLGFPLGKVVNAVAFPQTGGTPATGTKPAGPAAPLDDKTKAELIMAAVLLAGVLLLALGTWSIVKD